MKRMLLSIMFSVGLFTGCIHEDCSIETQTKGLVNPSLYADVAADSPFTGTLEVYPCRQGGPIYFGNYQSDGLTSFNASYVVLGGTANQSSNPVLLPIGTYNMVYWGVPSAVTPMYEDIAIKSPPLTLGADLSTLYWSLFPRNDGTYHPVYDYVFAVNPVRIGIENLTANLQRVTAAMDVIVQNKDNAPFTSEFESVWIYINGVAESLNVYTAQSSNQTKTVSFDLTLTPDKLKFISKTVMLFPSIDKPLLQIFIQLRNGKLKAYQQYLAETLLSGNKLTLTLTLGEIFSTESSTGNFSVSSWIEKSESIVVPPL